MDAKKILTGLTLGVLGALVISFLFSGNLAAQDWRKSIEDEDPTFFQLHEKFYQYYATEGFQNRGAWKQFKRWEWYTRPRLDASGRLNPNLLWQGWLEKKERFGSADSAANATWTQLGPLTLPSEFSEWGIPGMGRLNSITFHPTNPSIIWVGSPAGGLWKTTDDGTTWTNLTDQLPNLGVSALLVHPSNPDIMYMATGDGDGGDTYSIGVLKSTDGGQTWNATGLSTGVSDRWRIRELMMHPANPDIILGAFSRGVYKTTDAGANWTQTQSGNFKDIEVDPFDSGIWYAAASDNGIYKSTNSGDNWTKLSNGLPDSGFGRIAIALTPAAANTIYALYVNSSNGFLGLYRSTDAGQSWTLRSNSPNILGWELDGSDFGGQGYYDLTLDINRGNADTVYIGGVNQWKSVNGGAAWNIMSMWYTGTSTPYAHADQHAFAFHPTQNNTLYVANDGGLFKSVDDGATWTDLSNGLGIHQIYRLGVSAQNSNIFIVGNQDNGSDAYVEGGWRTIFGGDGMDNGVDPLDSSIFYCSVYNGAFYRSVDSGLNWVGISGVFEDEGAWVTPLLVVENQGNSVLYTASTEVYRSDTRGREWTAISGTISGQPLTALAIAPTDHNYIYGAVSSRFWATYDGGANWSEPTESTLPPNISFIAVHPQQPTVVYVTCSGYVDGKKVYVSNDGGRNWSNFTGALPNIPINCITLDPVAATVYIGTDLGVFFSAPGAVSWEAYDEGLPNVIVNDLEISINDNKIRAATYGRGVWESPLAQLPAIFPPSDITGGRSRNYTFLNLEYVDLLTWTANPANQGKNLVNYKIYKVVNGNDILIESVSGTTLQYYVRKVENADAVYCITSVDDEGNESTKTCVSVK